MGQTAVRHDVLQHRVPRRTLLFLLIFNNFQYIIAIPILALIIFLDTNPLISIGLGLLAILGLSAFWTAYHLDFSVQAKEHPHNKKWNHYQSILSPVARAIQNRPAWQLSLLGLLLVSTPILIITWPLLASQPILEVQPRLGFDLYWLGYIPVLIWISYHAHNHRSEWFGILWLVSASIYSICFFIVYNEISSENIAHLSILMGWFLFLSSLTHYLFRRIAILRGQAELLQTITARLRDDRRYTEAFGIRPVQSRPDVALNEIAEDIGTMLFYDRVFILVCDHERGALYMKGRYGINAPWPEAGWSISQKPSITGWVALNKDAHLCLDTRKCALFYNPEEAYPCKSEATVPIIVEGECVGVIDIESAHVNAFQQSDIRLLWQIANSIGAALGYERHISKEVDKAYELLEDASEILIHSKNLDEALKKVTQKLREKFNADLVILYKHAVATCVPLPGLIFDGEAIYPDLLGHSIRNDSRINELIRKTSGLYIQSDAEKDPFLLGPNDGDYNLDDAHVYGNSHRFVKREKIRSMIYIKLGLGNDIVGSLFLNYRRPINFQSRMIKSLRAFANVLTMGLILKRQSERAMGPLAGAIPLAHSTAEAAFESVSRDFDDIEWKQIKHTSENQDLLKQIKAYRGKLEELRREWRNLLLVEQVNLHRSSMVEPITHLESKLLSMFPSVSFKWDSREFLDIPTDELGEVIYKVIAEGASNALVHGHANRIHIQGKKENNTIQIVVSNNGKTMDLGQASRMNDLMFNVSESEKPTGIIPILLDSRRWFGAEWNFSITATNNTNLTVVFPLGINDEKEEYAYEDET